MTLEAATQRFVHFRIKGGKKNVRKGVTGLFERPHMSMAERCGICARHRQMAQRLSYGNGSMSLRVRGQDERGDPKSKGEFSSRRLDMPLVPAQGRFQI
ncbi:hypothetical protein AVEN_154356-1 [Araneus ventricosus]|uniref:Uncharacterized protein n=1 Tax=Araneus ventricosus TaxID=182803 RepID=A0A4Y2SNA4_ARAVE|nr:hypothetical protein AVEN_154356-1 [Araneus ventricosus]